MAALWIGIIVITVGVSSFAALYLRTIALDNAEREVKNVAFILAEQTAYYAQNVDLILLQYRNWRRRATPEQLADARLQHEILRVGVAGAAQVRAMNVYNAEGRLIHSSVLQQAPRISVEDRDFFQNAREATDDLPLMGAPTLSRLDGAWVLTIGRRLDMEDEKGDFKGVVAISLSSDYFRQFYRSINLGEGGRIVMMDRNRKVQVVEPAEDGEIGGVLSSASTEDRIVSEQQTRAYPFLISVAIDKRSALAGWRSQAAFLMIGGAGLILVASVFLGIVRRQLHRRTQLSVQLRNAHDDAVAANRARADFLARMSHELRTPMTGVLGIADLMSTEPLPPEQARRLMVLSNSARALLTVINDILDFSKIDAGRLEIEALPFDWVGLLRDVEALLRGGAEQKGLLFRTETSGATSNKVIGDAMRLKQILVNLVGNAIKFTEKGSVLVKAVGAPRDGRLRLAIEIADTGVGITPQQMSRLFRPFEQADVTTTRRFGGTGLGLAISDNLLRLMGGAMVVDSEPGVGTRFQITLDLETAAEIAPELKPAQPSPKTLRGLSILLAEDNDVNRDLIVAMLSAMQGHEVTAVANGKEAVEAAQSQRFNLILLDIHMPIMDGMDAIQAIRALPGAAGRTKAIALTADAILGQDEVFRKAGFNECVTKPINWARLNTVIEQLMLDAGVRLSETL
jgi:signal transduction histidine kinase/CheY-like chemotaxis protein